MAQKSGYLNRTLEFHKIYEEEIIPILKSYKQQKEKADEKNRLFGSCAMLSKFNYVYASLFWFCRKILFDDISYS